MSQSSPALIDLSHFDVIKYAPTELIGREAETRLLNDAWAKVRNHEAGRPRILTFVAMGGEGKTSLVADWAAKLAAQDWPGCDAVFAWSFYSQGTREQMAASSDAFLSAALTFFGDAEMAGSPQGAYEKARRLAQLVGAQRSLLILDGLEPLQYAPTSPTPGELKDQGMAALLKALANNSNGLCVITTRYPIRELNAFKDKTVLEEKLLRLSREAGVHLLRKLGVKGRQSEFEQLVEDVKGHALTLNLLGSYLRDAHNGDIRKRNLVKLEEADAENEHGGHAFHVMDAYTAWLESAGERGKRALALLSLMGLFDRTATADCLHALWHGEPITGLTEPLVGLNDAQRNISFKRLEEANLMTVNRDASGVLTSLDAHPLLREYFAKHLRGQQPETWRAAHRRLYEHLCTTTKEGAEPTLENLQPLYQAVSHGCQAGLQQETCEQIYYMRIQREDEHYSIRKLGAFASVLAAVACFFETPWNRVSSGLTTTYQLWLMHEVGYVLRGLGRLAESLEPMRICGEKDVWLKDWNSATTSLSNLSELKLMLGDVTGAVKDAEQSMNYAERSNNPYHGLLRRTSYGDALHQAGQRTEATKYFREAEQMQAEIEPNQPLYSVQGFNYCDVLLTEAEFTAWRSTLDVSLVSYAEDSYLITSCLAISKRAERMLEWTERHNSSLLTTALEHLAFSRSMLYATILDPSSFNFGIISSELHIAIAGLRQAGTQGYIPSGLLTRSWLRFLTGVRTGPDSAQEDLDEAWEIAERGPMRLHMADIHLYRARLFGGTKEGKAMEYPWDSPQADLAAARKLIEQCGYWRRKEELEDAEMAILGAVQGSASP